MYSENGVQVDFEEISKLIDAADVFVVGFANFEERLLVDTRSDIKESALIQVVEQVSSARDRLAKLYRRRPSLGMPEAFSFFSWPHSPAFMEESGVWQSICSRAGADRDPAAGIQADLALEELKHLDTEAWMAMLRGDNCVTLWPPEPDDDE